MLHIPELDQSIALHLELPHLLNLKQCNQYLNELLSTNIFWKHKVQHDYGVAAYKPAHESYAEQYQRLYNSNADMYYIVMLGLLDEVIINAQQINEVIYEVQTEEGPLEEFTLADLAFYYQHYDIMMYLIDQNIELSDNVVEYAARDGLLNILEWFASDGVLPTFYGVDLAIYNHHTDTVRWLVQNHIYPSSASLEYAIEHQLQDILNILQVQH